MPPTKKSTIGALEHRKLYHLEQSDKTFNISLWDVSGQDKFRSIANMYFRDADAALILYDITNRKSFEAVQSWINELHEKAPTNITIIVVGNKSDLQDQIQVQLSEGNDYCMKRDLFHRHISARKNLGIQEMFQKLGERLLTRPSNVKIYLVMVNIDGLERNYQQF